MHEKGGRREERGHQEKKETGQQSVAYMIPILLMEGTDSEERRKTEVEEKPKQ